MAHTALRPPTLCLYSSSVKSVNKPKGQARTWLNGAYCCILKSGDQT